MEIIYLENIHYLDPGTGMNIFHVLSALGISVAVYFKNFKAYLYNFFKDTSKKFKKES
tara:strand:- start:157 stop:330 length:174 start_codon:yes stop_codon:yes gene_type:complete